ncbi:hypothetical protein PC128_g2003 [Phytophthora cactorum]|nr:hypothetical protein PC120_g8409 [Phytophthora cactorum]KAG3106860.1 hypothetical protein PC121_g74 [Phytophthora cactorum]KAG3129968.1 hypothetical protein C6341_g23941 [Phytophthora cactorum]KAG3204265.1 hypothetical protein PC128_g2003 [Phytophthora cactorum]KAG4040594.1 hypothetical protein PC123_g23868 [Phytophthora cactorum]
MLSVYTPSFSSSSGYSISALNLDRDITLDSATHREGRLNRKLLAQQTEGKFARLAVTDKDDPRKEHMLVLALASHDHCVDYVGLELNNAQTRSVTQP